MVKNYSGGEHVLGNNKKCTLPKVVVVTGASGYIGRNLCVYLARKGVKIYAISRKECVHFAEQNITVINGDILHYKSMLSKIPLRVDALFHLAWNGCDTDERNDMLLQIKNIDLAIATEAFAVALKCKRIIFPGSPLEYQDGNKIISPGAVPAPHNSYGAVKVACHYILESLCKQDKIEFIYVMISSVYGLGRSQGIISYAIKSLLENKKTAFTKLEQYWDYVHIDDVVNGLWLILEKGKAGRFYCLGAGDNIRLEEYIKIIDKIIKPKVPLGIGEIVYNDGVMPQACVDLTTIYEDTGYKPRVSFSDAVREIIQEEKNERTKRFVPVV